MLEKPLKIATLARVLRRNLPQGDGRVLIVDDNPDDRRLMRDYLQAGRAEIEMARNGKEALEILERFTPDLMVVDLVMPVMDGATLLRELRSDPRLIDLPVVVVTARDLGREELERLGRLASQVLRKGADLEERLRSLFSNVLARKAAAG